jgi:hypothetical protein
MHHSIGFVKWIQELRHRVDPPFARRTSRYNDTASTLCGRWQLIYEVRKIVALNFFLDRCKKWISAQLNS